MNSMEKIIDLIYETPIFKGVDKDQIYHVIKCLKGVIKEYDKEEYIYRTGENIKKFGLVISGMVDIVVPLPSGDSYLIKRNYSKDIFGEAFAASKMNMGTMEIISKNKSEILFLEIPKAITEKACCRNPFKYVVMENLMILIAENNIFLNNKNQLISQKKLRDKILMYFYSLKNSLVNDEIFIPFNREELANYLVADRSALSRELSRMKKEGIIEINGSKIHIIE